ncbi:hypothetical protein [Myceligenerans pegani]|uniref:Integral membrane protein n=1 Tax=Myceligenerans pegani TaxID=2776917 RepID=A0ABR9N431_9MICO|nr:hypothetical protein [Myceligenerans sp. TRM 65318]MBE1878431.1 hypothetical protein [Myceligenerans sp. TRM 65318]MBE3020702.1 hypothetical protein [Myceligenerans sp. TRM 65318]
MTAPPDHPASCTCPSCWADRAEYRRHTAHGLAIVLGVVGGLTLLVVWFGLGRQSGEIFWVVFAFATIIGAVLRWPHHVERSNPNAHPRRVGAVGARVAVGIDIGLNAAVGVLLLLAATRVGPGQAIASVLHTIDSVSEQADLLGMRIEAALGLFVTVLWLTGLGLTGVIGSLIVAWRAVAGRGRRRYGEDWKGWRYGLGGLALLALAYLLLSYAVDTNWLGDAFP